MAQTEHYDENMTMGFFDSKGLPITYDILEAEDMMTLMTRLYDGMYRECTATPLLSLPIRSCTSAFCVTVMVSPFRKRGEPSRAGVL